ncbi:hypothetical protein D7M11_26120 [Paenibacillus ginsengarvi]|uniref:Uncharacterized protein n=1 Tax=Paenibacillus ginsengarvi TaxID=400777 RepID=A0A3B0BNS3_9BACL|nr:hypothetical protein D7M11_26120 [Paenibacillus ginsengarvi]
MDPLLLLKIVSSIFYACPLIFIFLIFLDFFALNKLKKKCFSAFHRRSLKRNEKKQLQKDTYYLFEALNSLSPEQLRRLKMIIRREPEDTFSPTTFNIIIAVTTIFAAFLTLLLTHYSLSSDTFFKDYFFNATMDIFSRLPIITIVIFSYSARLIFSSLIDTRKRQLTKHFLSAIDESESFLPLNNRLSGG